jgi:hypothetical protein
MRDSGSDSRPSWTLRFNRVAKKVAPRDQGYGKGPNATLFPKEARDVFDLEPEPYSRMGKTQRT